MSSRVPSLDVVRGAVAAGLNVWGGGCDVEERMPTLRADLIRYVTSLREEIEEQAPRMRGEMRLLAVHVLVRTHQLMEQAGRDDECAPAVPDLAVMCRCLVSLYEQPGVLREPFGAEEIRAAIERRTCNTCRRPIVAGEPFVQQVSGESGSVEVQHTEPCVGAQRLRPELSSPRPLGQRPKAVARKPLKGR